MKKFVAGLLTGLILATGITSFASSEVIAQFASFNFLVNGQQKTIEARPVTINGSSYLPVKDVANMLGYDVTYKADTRTIEFNNANQTISLPTQPSRIIDITPIATNQIEITEDPFENRTTLTGIIGEEIELYKSKIKVNSLKNLGELERNPEYHIIEINFDFFLPGEPTSNNRPIGKNRILNIGIDRMYKQRTRSVIYTPITNFSDINYKYGDWTNIILQLAIKDEDVHQINSITFRDTFNRNYLATIEI
ncbi:copper amine oxidase [Clostridium aceticum]|uniref:Copper amine oxidase n=1 Tax=Clostridium aceticum TaxID=84022 RepID=A0A0D8I7P7_9CLOT|nr:stalk domain-containing protein [Clostridium aceticum]AKL96608.1 copper amine oxidase [Clostridium aceticum]KJF26084.1 hypothetical protein TZ02_15305 [Clostridium aceticum]